MSDIPKNKIDEYTERLKSLGERLNKAKPKYETISEYKEKLSHRDIVSEVIADAYIESDEDDQCQEIFMIEIVSAKEVQDIFDWKEKQLQTKESAIAEAKAKSLCTVTLLK